MRVRDKRAARVAKLAELLQSQNRIKVRVTPKAARNRVEIEDGPDGSTTFRVWVTSAPEKGKANLQVLRLIADELGLPRSRLAITQGLNGRDKTISFRI